MHPAWLLGMLGAVVLVFACVIAVGWTLQVPRHVMPQKPTPTSVAQKSSREFGAVQLMCSRGVLFATTWHAESPRSSAVDVSHVHDALERMSAGDSIYICTEALPRFVSEFLPRVQTPFVLVVGDSDETIDARSPPVQELLRSPQLLRLFGQNMVHLQDKCEQLPIGLDYHTVRAAALSAPRARPSHAVHPWLRAEDGTTPAEQEELLFRIRKDARERAQQTPRRRLVYANFGVFDKRGDRKAALAAIPPDLLVFEAASSLPRADVWRATTEHEFVLSPFGNGFDCHRTWEALALGAIPIVRGRHFADMFSGLPVLQVHAWTDVNKELLDQAASTFSEHLCWGTHTFEKQTLAYWIQRINTSSPGASVG